MRRIIYSISIFLSFTILSGLFCSYYQIHKLQAQVDQLQQEQQMKEPQFISADTSASSAGYYLMEEEGQVCVYRGDKSSLYEQTNIEVKDLPDRLQEEIHQGKYLESETELYSFLENYSS